MQLVMWLLLVTVIVTTFATGQFFAGMVATAVQIFVLDLMTFTGALRLPLD